MGMEETLKNSVLIGIFVIAITSFAIMFALNNQSDVTLNSGTDFSSLNSSLRNDIGNLQDDANSSYQVMLKTSLSSGDSEISGSGGQFKVGPFTSISMATRSLKTGFNTIFGANGEFGFILVAFVSLFTFLIGYYVIKAWLGRDPS